MRPVLKSGPPPSTPCPPARSPLPRIPGSCRSRAHRDVDRQLTNARIGVFVCGGDSLCDSVEAAVLDTQAGCETGNKFVFHKEMFG